LEQLCERHILVRVAYKSIMKKWVHASLPFGGYADFADIVRMLGLAT
jgi:hypothetical protein